MENCSALSQPWWKISIKFKLNHNKLYKSVVIITFNFNLNYFEVENMIKTLGAIVLAWAFTLGIGGCEKEKEYRVEIEEGYTCKASLGGDQDHVWVNKGESMIGAKTITRCTGENCMPAVSYAVDPSGSSTEERFALEVVMENGEFTTDSSWYGDPKERKEGIEGYQLIKKCEDLLEQTYKKGF